MIELLKKFNGIGEVSGTNFEQLFESDKVYMYKLTDTEDGDVRYEVFERKEQKEQDVNFGGQVAHYESKVRYPKSNDFGDWAFCFRNYDKAVKKFNEINVAVKNAKTEVV